MPLLTIFAGEKQKGVAAAAFPVHTQAAVSHTWRHTKTIRKYLWRRQYPLDFHRR